MGLIELILMLAVVGFILWMIQTYVPMPAPFKTAIIVIVVVVMCVWLLRVAGIGDIPIGRR